MLAIQNNAVCVTCEFIYSVSCYCEVTLHRLQAATREGKGSSLPIAVRFTARWHLVVTHYSVNTRASGGWQPEVHSNDFYVFQNFNVVP